MEAAGGSSTVDTVHLISYGTVPTVNVAADCNSLPSSTLERLQLTGHHLSDSLRAKMHNSSATFLPNYSKSPSQLLLSSDDNSIWGDVALEVRSSSAEADLNPAASSAAVPSTTSTKNSLMESARRVAQWSFNSIKSRIALCPCKATVKTFAFAICVLITVHGALSIGYTMSVITTIEKRFQMASTTSGMIVSSYEVGSLLSVVFVSYFGSSGHVPRWIGCGGLVLALGSFLFSLPHYIATPYSYFANKSIDAIIWLKPTADRLSQDPHLCQHGELASVNVTSQPEMVESSANSYVLTFMLAQILLGVGGSPLFTLGTSYLDDRLDKDSSSVYLAIMYVMLAFGPVCGFLLGGLFLSEYVDPSSAPPDINSQSAGWVGLWWGGFIICGFLYFLSALPFFFFSRPSGGESAPPTDASGSPSYGKDLRKIPVSIFRLVTNSVYMVTSLNACVDLAIVSGFTVFLPKYLETQFLMSKSDASIFTGSVAVPGACIGTLFGGWVLKRLKMVMGHVANYVVLINCTAVVLLGSLFFLGCDGLRVAGVNEPYAQAIGPVDAPTPSAYPWHQCNMNCSCSLRDMQPICGMDGVTYLSPCFAGCRSYAVTSGGKRPSIVGDVDMLYRNYVNCSCINSRSWTSANHSQPSQAVDGPCTTKCNMLAPFLVMLFLITLVAANNQMPLVMITLRAVNEEEKAFALGLQVVFLRLLSYLPAPIIFGAIIDTTCTLTNDSWGSVGTSCLFYDTEAFRYRFAMLCLILKVVGFAVSCLMWWCIRRRYVPFSPPVTMSEIVHRLGDIENLHLQRCDTKASLRHWVSDDSLYSRPRSPRHRKTLSS
uniref:Solute carrier organic anion transporter family member n=1 Tax=Trichuris muris TaxID=70415 RepID=A0A5S6R4Q8_TRIMR